VLATLILLAAAAPHLSAAAEEKPVPPAVGATVSNFILKDVHRRPRALADYKDKKAVVVVFVGTECPLANLYVPTLIALHRAYADKGVQFLLVNANAQDSFNRVSGHAQERDVPFLVLKDFEGRVADGFGAKRTPEVFLLDAGRVIRYHGRIDDQYGIGFRREQPGRRDLQDALDELLAGKPVARPETEVSGCVIGRRGDPTVRGEVTYAKQVSRILQQRCQECHRPGEIGPFALMTYKDARDWAETIREVVLEERMPPWHADPHYGTFANDRRLSREEADTLLVWVKAGCPRGDDNDLPPPRPFPDGWKVGQPDAVYRMADEFKVPATGVLNYQRFVVDPGFKEDVWVQTAECRPGNRAVVHHILVYIQQPGKQLYEKDGTASILVGWAPGDMPAVYPRGTARRVPAGSKFVFEVHYTPDGTARTDRSSVGITFAPKAPERVVETNIFPNMTFRIPPRSIHTARAEMVLPEDALLLGCMPHLHLRGVSARYEATYPDGRTVTLLSVPDYDFGWQSTYGFAEPLRLPKGTKLAWVAHWDNTADNPRNPDPSKEVGWGLQTWDEMMNGWIELVWLKPKIGP
jgi:peroxiredoxin